MEVSVSGVRLVGRSCRVTRLRDPPVPALVLLVVPPSYIVPGASFLVGVRGLPVLVDADRYMRRAACRMCPRRMM